MYQLSDFTAGDRIQMHPATDYWMRGARFGEVVKVGRAKLEVKLDMFGRTFRTSPQNISEIIRD